MEHEQGPNDGIDGDSSLGESPSNYLNLNENQDPQNASASSHSEPSIGNEQGVRVPRGPNKIPKGRYTVTALAAIGNPVEPLSAVKAWRTVCGCIVRDFVPIKDVFGLRDFLGWDRAILFL